MSTRYQVGAAGSHGFGTPDQTCLRGSRTGLQDLSGSGHQIKHACEVSRWGCRISRVWNTRSKMPTRYMYLVGAAGSHGFGTPDRTCPRVIRTGLQDLTGSGHQIEHACEVSGWGCRISWVRDTKSAFHCIHWIGAQLSLKLDSKLQQLDDRLTAFANQNTCKCNFADISASQSDIKDSLMVIKTDLGRKANSIITKSQSVMDT